MTQRSTVHRFAAPPQPDSRYEAVTLANFEALPQIQQLPAALRHDMRVVAQVLPFKSNRYVVDHLIDWSAAPEDPLFRLNFPHRDMLAPAHFAAVQRLLRAGAPKAELARVVDGIRRELNPHPAGQREYNVPYFEGQPLGGMQHKYRETVLFFPSQGQTCHAYCSFCFRWPQFVGMHGLKFATREAELLQRYVKAHPELSDVLFTGGDPLVMKAELLAQYLEPLLAPGAAPNLISIRIGSKSLAYWPQRFLTDDDADDLLALFERVVRSGRNLAFMAHFNHPREQSVRLAQNAIARLRNAGVTIRTQTPLLRNINDDAGALARMWREQVRLGCVPYYLFVARDTGAKRYFEVPLERCWNIFREAYSEISGLARTVRGPSMSALPGKVQVLGISEHEGEKVFVLRFLQGRSPAWVDRPFFAKYDPAAHWLSELRPAGDAPEFFYEAELREMLARPETPRSRTETDDE